MKSAFVRLSLLLLSLTIPVCAQVIDVNLTAGNVTAGPGSTYGESPVTSFLTAPGYTITNISGDDPGNTGIGTQCSDATGGCTVAQIGSSIVTGFGIIAFPPNGGMVVNGQSFGMWGFPGFIATTFNSSVGANGGLMVYGNAAGYSSLNECDLQNDCGNLPLETNFLFGNTKWQYVGQFVPDPNNQASYDLQSIVISSIPVPLINQPLVPGSTAPGSAGFTLTVNGTGFASDSVVNWNGSPRATNFISPSQLTATVLGSDIATNGTTSVTVTSASPGGGVSNVQFFGITNATNPLASTNGTFGTDSQPTWIAVADLNSDGKQDLVTVNVSDTVSVILGNGDGTFQMPTNYRTGPTGQNPDCVAVGDVNRDGKLDMVVLNAESAQVSILLGNGDGTFQPATQFPTGSISPPQSLVIGDFNGDGDLDVAVTDLSDGTVSVLLGNGDGTFQPPQKLSAGSDPQYIVTGDFNHDGVLDLAVSNSGSSTISILLGNGDGTFLPPIAYSAGSNAYHLITADLNGDGNLDLAVDNYGGSISILLGNGDGTFLPPVTYTVGSSTPQIWGLAFGDLNGDGKLDLEVVDAGASPAAIDVLFGNGDGTFQPQIVYAAVAYGPIVGADFNNDGRFDLAVASRNGSGGTILLQVPSAGLSSTGLSFGSVNVGATSNPQGVILTNTGSAPLVISSIAISGANATDFSETNNCGSSLSAGANCTLTVTFSPTAIGSRTASLTLTDNAFGSPQTVSLSGTGLGATAVLTPTALNFMNQTVGVASPSQSVTLTNTGNTTLTIASIVVSLSNGSYAQNTNCGTSVAAGASCMFSVSWTPGLSGNMTGSITFTDAAVNSPQVVSLTGIGVLPAVKISPNSLSFPTQVVFTSSQAMTVTLTNSGLGILNITKTSVIGRFVQTNTCGTSVAAGQSCTFSVKFKPTTIGALTGAVSITDNASGSPQEISLTGVGTYVQLSPTSLNFGNQPVGTKSLPKRVTLSNKGSVEVSITGISIAGTDPGDFAQTNNCGKNLKSGASCFITVTFTPLTKGKRTASVAVSDNGGGSPQKVGLAGAGT